MIGILCTAELFMHIAELGGNPCFIFSYKAIFIQNTKWIKNYTTTRHTFRVLMTNVSAFYFFVVWSFCVYAKLHWNAFSHRLYVLYKRIHLLLRIISLLKCAITMRANVWQQVVRRHPSFASECIDKVLPPQSHISFSFYGNAPFKELFGG